MAKKKKVGQKAKAELLQENTDTDTANTESVQEDTSEVKAELLQENVDAGEATTEVLQKEDAVQEKKNIATANKKLKTKKIIGHEERTNRYGYIFVAPFVLAFLIFNFWPTINTFVVSFTDLRGLKKDYIFSNARCPSCDATGQLLQIDNNGAPKLDAQGEFVFETCDVCHGTGRITPGKYNYSKLVKDRYFWEALGNTFIIWGLNFIPQLGMALILAIWLSDARLNLAGKGLFRAVVYMPNLLTAASVALLYRSLFGFGGHLTAPANQFLSSLGIQATVLFNGEYVKEAFNFFRSVPFARGLTAFIQWWMWYGHTLIMLMAGITSIPTSLYESATVDGANSTQTALFITLPLLRPMMLYILVTSMIGGMQMFDIPYLLTSGNGAPNFKIRTTVVYQYNVAFGMGVGDKAYGAAISVGIFIITIILAMLIFFFLQDRSDLAKRKGGMK
ncbi:MAG: ABC transporter permease subunit [Treponema sp.]|jgi:multiple sugar transport system permease protein|nr:ABC transporter permease subunit [Treponema sp.]